MLNRIPDVLNESREAMGLWFLEMANAGLIYHPEESAANILKIESHASFFTKEEARKAQSIIDGFYARFEYDQVIGACYPHFMKAAGFQP